MALAYSVYVVDDIPEIVDLICRFLGAAGDFECRTFTSTERLLEEFRPDSVDCIVADLMMPNLDGSELHQKVLQVDPHLSFVFVSGHADVRTAVRLMEQGALTVLEKPLNSQELVQAVRRGCERTRRLRAEHSDVRDAARMLQTLTKEEHDVLQCIMEGLPNKGIAHRLSLSPRTVDRRRQSVLQKMNVVSVAELVATVTRIRSEPQP